MTALLLAAALLVSAVFVWGLIRLERRGRRVAVVVLLLGLLVVESVLYPNPFDVPAGLFHPEAGTLSFRLYEVVIVLALAARLIVRPRLRFQTPTLLWTAFFVWLITQATVGLYSRHPLDLVTFEAKAAVYIGALALTAGVPSEEWRRSRGLTRFMVASAVLSAVIIFMTRAHVIVQFDLPGLPRLTFGEMGSDAATLFAALGVIAVAVALCRASWRLPLIVAAAPLLVAPVVATQRAALVGLLVSIGVLLAAWVTATGARRATATPTEVLLGLLVVVALVAFPVVRGAASGGTLAVPFQDSFQTVLESRGKQLSAEGRLNQWAKAVPLIRQSPVLGHGLGTTYRYFDPGRYEFVQTDLTHNIVGDLFLRTGAIGVLLFLLAAGATLRRGLRAWRFHLDAQTAALSIGCVAVVSGLLAKGMVESLFEKFRLATLLGLLLGMMLSMASSAGARRKDPIAWS